MQQFIGRDVSLACKNATLSLLEFHGACFGCLGHGNVAGREKSCVATEFGVSVLYRPINPTVTIQICLPIHRLQPNSPITQQIIDMILPNLLNHSLRREIPKLSQWLYFPYFLRSFGPQCLD